jgi:hypothetical protein
MVFAHIAWHDKAQPVGTALFQCVHYDRQISVIAETVFMTRTNL